MSSCRTVAGMLCMGLLYKHGMFQPTTSLTLSRCVGAVKFQHVPRCLGWKWSEARTLSPPKPPSDTERNTNEQLEALRLAGTMKPLDWFLTMEAGI